MLLRTAFLSIVLTASSLVFIAAGCGSKVSPIENETKGGMPLPLKVKGNQILNSKNQPVTLRGVNTASLEWTSDGEGYILETVRVAIDDWNVNIIRLPLSQDRWFGKAPEQNDQGAAYRALVQEIVNLCSSKGCYIILDLHWSNVNEWGQNIGQHSMPDRNSVLFWKDFAPVYANHPAVLFDLYNEPHDVSWDVWLNGGRIMDRPNQSRMVAKEYEAVGMQELLDTVRSTGAKNVIVAGGLDWAYDLKGILEGRQLKDPTGNGVIYAMHAYDNKKQSVFTWIADMKEATARLPVIVSEFGGSGGPNRRRGWWGQSPSTATGDDWLLHVLQAIVDHNWSFTAWDLHISAGPTLISDWDYTPTPDFGVYVKQLLVTGKLPQYTPPDLRQLARGPAFILPESARIGGSELYGDWQLKPDPNDRMSNSILSFAPDSEGKLFGQWVYSRNFSELEDIRYKDGTITFTQTVRFDNELYQGYFTGTIKNDTITGSITHGPNQSKIEGKRIPEIPLAAGLWDMLLGTNKGPIKAILAVKAARDGTLTAQWQKREGQHTITNPKSEGSKLTFTTFTRADGIDKTYSFEGNIDSKENVLTGIFKDQAMMMPAAATRIGTELIGIWYLDVTTPGGDIRQRLKINPDMSGMYGTTPIEKINLEGNLVTFKFTPAFGRMRFEMNFEGNIEGTKLTGELKNQRGSQTLAGKKAGI